MSKSCVPGTPMSAAIAAQAAGDPFMPIKPLRHPYLLFHAEDIPAIRALAQDKDRYGAYISSHELWLEIKRRADQKLDVDVRAIKEPKVNPWIPHFPEIYETASTLAFAYVVIGDERYATKAREFALHYAGWSRWANQSPDPRYKIRYATGSVVNEVALAYDMLYDRLSDDERAILRRAIIEKGLKDLYYGYFHFDPLRTFYNLSDPWDGFLHGALAVYPDTKDSLPRRSLEVALEWFEQSLEWCKEDGACDDGYDHGVISANATAMTCEVLKRLFDRDYYDHPFIRKAPLFFLHLFTPDGHTVDFNDAHSTDVWPTAALVHFGNTTHNDWTYGLINRFRLLWRSSPEKAHVLFTFLQWRPETAPKWPPPFPASRAFRTVGWVTLRDKWEKTGTLFALKSGMPKWSHEHSDGNHFVLNYQGAHLISDNGNSSHSDGRAANYQYCTGGHNTVIVDTDWDELEENRNNVKTNMQSGKDGHSWAGQTAGQGYRAEVFVNQGDRAERYAEVAQVAASLRRGHIKQLLTTDFFDYTLADAHELYEAHFGVRRFDRHVIFDKLSACFVIFDHLASDQPQWWDFILHTNGKYQSSGEFAVNETERLITATVDEGSVLNRGAVLNVHVLEPADPQITLRRWWDDNEPDGKEKNNLYGPFVTVRPKEKLTQAHFMTLLRPMPKYVEPETPDAEPKPYRNEATVRRLWGEGWTGAEVSNGQNRALYLCRLGYSTEIEAEGISTDAALAAVCYNGVAVETAAIVDGKVLRTGKDDLLRAGAPVTAAIRWTENELCGHVDVLAACELALHVGSAGIDRATLNGKPIRFSQQGAGQTVHLQLPGSGELEVSFKKK